MAVGRHLLGWRGNPGRGRALGAGEIKFFGQVLPNAQKVTYELDFKRVIERKLVMGIADGRVLVDGREIYSATDLKVGLFTTTGLLMLRRVVVTGQGIVSSLGNNIAEVDASLRAARSGIRFNPTYAERGMRCQVSGRPSIDLEASIDRRTSASWATRRLYLPTWRCSRPLSNRVCSRTRSRTRAPASSPARAVPPA